jgi:hypothetical protein
MNRRIPLVAVSSTPYNEAVASWKGSRQFWSLALLLRDGDQSPIHDLVWNGLGQLKEGTMRMRRILTFLVGVGLFVAITAAASSAQGSGGATEFEVIVLPNLDTEVYYDWGWTLYEELTTTDGEHLGWSGGPCFNLNPALGDESEDFVCDLGMRFPDGDITVNGPIGLDDGTGKFRHISGEVAIIPAEDFSYSTLIFRVKHAKAGY